MRKFFVGAFMLCVVMTSMVSCLTSSVDTTPYVQPSVFLRNPIFVNDQLVGAQDTVKIALDDKLGCYVLDTIHTTDTVMFMMGFGSRLNDLTKAIVDIDKSAIWTSYVVGEEIQKVLTDESNSENGYLVFKPNYNFVAFPIYYSPLKEGSHKMTFTVESDSKFSPVTVTFIQVVKD